MPASARAERLPSPAASPSPASSSAAAVDASNPSRSVWLGCALLVLLVWLGVAAFAFNDLNQERRERVAVVEADAKGFSEYVGLQLLVVGQLVQQLRRGYQSSGKVPPQEELRERLGRVGVLLLQVAVVDAQGLVVASSLPLNPGISIADREHFRVFVDDASDRLFFSKPVVGRVSGKVSLQLVRPLLGPAGDFRGVIVASIDPKYFQDYFGSLRAFEQGGAVVLASRDDGIIRARYTKDDLTWGTSLRTSVHWDRLAREVAGSYVATSVVDGARRVIGFHQAGNYPLMVSVSSLAPSLTFKGLSVPSLVALLLTIVTVQQSMLRVRRLREQQAVIARLEASRAEQEQANRLKSKFLASVSHELRTPLNSILGFSELIRDAPDDPSSGRYAELIHENGRHLHALVNTVLDLAKIEAGRMEVERSDFDVRDLVATLAEMHRPVSEKKGVAMRLEIDPSAQGTLQTSTDRTKLVQVLNNVLHNAVKFTSEGSITVGLRHVHPDTAVITVLDTGCGIPEDRLSGMFKWFATAHAAAPDQDQGSGLGLVLSRELMELLGGSIELRSQASRGTEITIRLPGVQAGARSDT